MVSATERGFCVHTRVEPPLGIVTLHGNASRGELWRLEAAVEVAWRMADRVVIDVSEVTFVRVPLRDALAGLERRFAAHPGRLTIVGLAWQSVRGS